MIKPYYEQYSTRYYPGEMMQVDHSLLLCYSMTYSWDYGGGRCKDCPENFNCKGGYIPISPKDNYWRENENSTKAIYCKNNKEACLAHDQC